MDALTDRLPNWLFEINGEFSLWWAALVMLVVLQLSLRRYAQNQETSLLVQVVRATFRPFLVIFTLLLTQSTIELMMGDMANLSLQHGIRIFLIMAVAWWILAGANALKRGILRHYDMTVADNYTARQAHTRIDVLYRIFQFFIILLTLAFILLTFEGVRAVGASLLAGAGVTGLILGLAAQKTLGAVFAGIQIAITQPIKLEDAVVIEGEWGWIEEITLTYVVVRIWDLRRLVVPITYFVEKPIQNWTRREAEIIGQVVIYADYRVPVDPLRQELTRLLGKSEHWNGRVNNLQVIDATESTVVLRALMTAKDSPTVWNLRCEVREGLIAFLQTHYPKALPTTRVQVEEKKTEAADA